MFNSVVHHLVREHALEDQLEAHHIIGQLKLFGVDLHQFFESPFFKDHDYNVVVDLLKFGGACCDRSECW
jgi:hypothetical protein